MQRAFLFPMWQPLPHLTLHWSKDGFSAPLFWSLAALLAQRILVCQRSSCKCREREGRAHGREPARHGHPELYMSITRKEVGVLQVTGTSV